MTGRDWLHCVETLFKDDNGQCHITLSKTIQNVVQFLVLMTMYVGGYYYHWLISIIMTNNRTPHRSVKEFNDIMQIIFNIDLIQ